MSRLGKKPVILPKDLTVSVKDQVIEVKGPKGTLTQKLVSGVNIKVEEQECFVSVDGQTKQDKANWGLYKRLLENMVAGVTSGFSKSLELKGVGFRAELKGATMVLSVGFSHPVTYDIPADVNAKVEKQTMIVLESCDKALLGQVAANIRSIRPPEPYKGKGIRYLGERVKMKAGKSGAKK